MFPNPTNSRLDPRHQTLGMSPYNSVPHERIPLLNITRFSATLIAVVNLALFWQSPTIPNNFWHGRSLQLSALLTASPLILFVGMLRRAMIVRFTLPRPTKNVNYSTFVLLVVELPNIETVVRFGLDVWIVVTFMWLFLFVRPRSRYMREFDEFLVRYSDLPNPIPAIYTLLLWWSLLLVPRIILSEPLEWFVVQMLNPKTFPDRISSASLFILVVYPVVDTSLYLWYCWQYPSSTVDQYVAAKSALPRRIVRILLRAKRRWFG